MPSARNLSKPSPATDSFKAEGPAHAEGEMLYEISRHERISASAGVISPAFPLRGKGLYGKLLLER